MTKPFESIRQLFGRVLGGKSAGEDTPRLDYSMLGINTPETRPSTNGNGQSEGLSDENSQAEIEAQTADTQRLPRVEPEFLDTRNDDANQHRVAPDEGADEFGDVLLDLGDVRGPRAFAADDPFLDVLDEILPQEDFHVEANPEASPFADDSTSITAAFAEDSSEAAAPVPAFEESREWHVAPETVAVEVAQPESDAEAGAPARVSSLTGVSDLSPAAIDLIAQRVVAQLSDKVVQEIAWEVVPEMAELLIKQKLDAR